MLTFSFCRASVTEFFRGDWHILSGRQQTFAIMELPDKDMDTASLPLHSGGAGTGEWQTLFPSASALAVTVLVIIVILPLPT